MALYFEQLDAQDEQEDEVEALGQRRDELLAEIESLEARREDLTRCQEEAQRKPAKRISPTDPEARIMKGRQGKHYSYNLQSAVDSTFGMIAVYQVTNQEKDKGLLVPMVEQLEEETDTDVEQTLADAGYHDTGQIQTLEAAGTQCYVAIDN